MLQSINGKLFKSVSVVLLFSCLFLFSENCFSQSVDTWEDQSDDLPGTGENTWIYITVGVVAVATLVYFIFIAPSGDNDKDKSKDKSSKIKNLTSTKLSQFKKDFRNNNPEFSSVKYLKSESLKDILKEGMKQESSFKSSLNKIEIPEYYHGLEMAAEEK